MLEVTTIGSHSHVGSQALGKKFATAVLMCICGISTQMVCRATFSSSVVLGFRLEFMVLFQHGALDMVVEMYQYSGF